LDQAWIDAGTWEVEIGAKRYPAIASLRPLFDPENKKIKGRETSGCPMRHPAMSALWNQLVRRGDHMKPAAHHVLIPRACSFARSFSGP
jgi:hypothetical protein